jgi:multidrug transporter EmrE-like cation transporter
MLLVNSFLTASLSFTHTRPPPNSAEVAAAGRQEQKACKDQFANSALNFIYPLPLHNESAFSMSPFLFIGVSTIFGVIGQLMLKRGMSGLSNTSDRNPLIFMAFSPWVIGGLLIYGIGVLAWLAALSQLEISYVYPFASIGYVGIILGSWFFFKEKISPLRIVGIIIIITGVLITSQS